MSTMAETAQMPKLSRSFLVAAIDHSCNDAKTSYQIVRSRFEEWKNGMSTKHTSEQLMDEKYTANYASRRAEREEAYKQWHASRDDIIKRIKGTNVAGEQERLMSELLRMPFPDVLRSPVEDVYTKYAANQ